MRTWLLVLVPCVLLGGLVIGAMKLGGLTHGSATCELGTCPLTVHESDAGKTFLYGVTTRFTVLLNENTNPQAHLACAPDGVAGSISNAPAVEPPLYAARFEGVAPGTCILSDDHFSATIVIQ